MLNEPTREKLYDLRLSAMAQAWSEQQGDPESPAQAFDERFGRLVDAEWMDRHNKRLGRALREAQLRIRDACIEDLTASPTRGLDKRLIRELATCQWVQTHHNVAITGATGVGKTYVACALAQQACRNVGGGEKARQSGDGEGDGAARRMACTADLSVGTRLGGCAGRGRSSDVDRRRG